MTAAAPDFSKRLIEFRRADGSGGICIRMDMISSWEKSPDGFGSIVWLTDGVTKYHVEAPTRKIKKLFTA